MDHSDPLLETPPRPNVVPRSSGARVRVIEESPPGYAAEVAVLLRRRLRAASLILAIVVFLAFWPVLSYPGLAVRLAVLVVIGACHLVLRSALPRSLRQLRMLELVILGTGAVQLVYTPRGQI